MSEEKKLSLEKSGDTASKTEPEKSRDRKRKLWDLGNKNKS